MKLWRFQGTVRFLSPDIACKTDCFCLFHRTHKASLSDKKILRLPYSESPELSGLTFVIRISRSA